MELLASSFGLMGRSLLLALAALVTFSNAAFAQPALETKQRFVAGLIRFMEALPGTYGDEGPRLVSSLDEMEAGLRRWDAGLRAYAKCHARTTAGCPASRCGGSPHALGCRASGARPV